jgi:hypothetical protein
VQPELHWAKLLDGQTTEPINARLATSLVVIILVIGVFLSVLLPPSLSFRRMTLE